jgi:argininosuccinate lyase
MPTPPDPLTGRVSAGPGRVLHEEVLEPQFRSESQHLLPFYIAIEKVLLLEYERMGLMTGGQAGAIAQLLREVKAEHLRADPAENMSDIAFAIERYVTARAVDLPATWHVDRSRNDLQACAQMLYGRELIDSCADSMLEFARAAHRLAGETTELPMPGYTHLQAAQVISPGFYLAGVCEQVLRTLDRLSVTYEAADASPLGAGAMAGQELPWDRERMAALIGCQRVQVHALTAVASRGWALEAAAELSLLGVSLSRIATDFMLWGSSAYGYITLPDALAGISSAMPQKKNYPVLERIRGRTAHLTSLYLDLAIGQRNTPFSNSVEVSKEANAHLPTLFDALRSALRMFTAVLDGVTFRADRMRAACAQDFLGGFALANLLCLTCGVPWRTAQVIAGEYVVAALKAGRSPTDADPGLLAEVAAGRGADVDVSLDDLRKVFDVEWNLNGKTTAGSTPPAAVRVLLADQAVRLDRHAEEWHARRRSRCAGLAETDQLLGLSDRADPGRIW